MRSQARSWAASAGVVIALCVAAASLDAYGRSRRVAGPARALATPPLATAVVDTPEEAYRAWRARGAHGRVVVSLGSRLYFVAPDVATEVGRGGAEDPADVAERALDARNFLLVAMEKGVARDVRHVLPDDVYARKAVAAAGEEGVRVERGRISAPFFGSPRSLTTLEAFSAPEEPVLLFVSASFFGARDAHEVWRRLAAAGLRTDFVVLCRSREDPEVAPPQRAQLAAFAALLEAAP